MADDDIEVHYTVKELLTSIRTDQTAGFARLHEAMAGKADKGDVLRLEGLIDGHARRIETLERDKEMREQRAAVHQARDEAEAERARRRWSVRERVLGAMAALATAGGTVALVLVTLH